MPLAVNVGAATLPEASAPTVTVLDPLVENTPLAPLAGALNVTGTPAAALVTAQPSLFVSATCSPVANALCRIAVCGVPATSVSWFGGLDDGQFDVPVPVGSVGDPAGFARGKRRATHEHATGRRPSLRR